MSRPKARPTARHGANRPTSTPVTWGGSAWPVRGQIGVALIAVSGVVVVPGLAEPFLLPKAAVAAVGVVLVLSVRRAMGLPRALSAVLAAGFVVLLTAALLADTPVSAVVGRYPRYEGIWVLPVYVGALVAGARMRAWPTAHRALDQALTAAAVVALLGALAQLAGVGSVERIGSVLGNASELGTWAAVVAVFLTPSALRGDRAPIVGAAASLLAVVLSGSRGGLAGLLAGLLVFVVLVWRQPGTRRAARLALGIVAGVLVLAALIPGMRQRILGGDPVAWATVSGRGWLWQDTMDLIAAHPFLGVGPSGFVDAIGEFHSLGWARDVGPVNPPDSPHNLILQLLSAGGLALLLVGIAGVVVWLRQARVTRRTDPDLTSAAGPAIVAGVVAMGVHFTSAATVPLLALLAGWVAAIPLTAPSPSRRSSQRCGVPVDPDDRSGLLRAGPHYGDRGRGPDRRCAGCDHPRGRPCRAGRVGDRAPLAALGSGPVAAPGSRHHLRRHPRAGDPHHLPVPHPGCHRPSAAFVGGRPGPGRMPRGQR